MKPTFLMSTAALLVSAPLFAQNSVPVYPGAKLQTSDEDACCSFVTKEPLASVVAFYESKLGAKAVTPAMQMPAGMQLRVISSGDNSIEITAAQGMTRFSLTPEQLGRAGAQHGFAWRKASNQMQPEDREYDDWFSRTSAADAVQVNLPLYPGARIEGERKSADCYNYTVYTTDSFEQVVSFYRAKLGDTFTKHDGETPESYSFLSQNFILYNCQTWSRDNPECGGFMKPTAAGTRGAVNKKIDLANSEVTVPVPPYLDPDLHTWVNKVAGTTFGVSSEQLDPACIEIPAGVQYVPFKP